jgi:hypothetical protein
LQLESSSFKFNVFEMLGHSKSNWSRLTNWNLNKLLIVRENHVEMIVYISNSFIWNDMAFHRH